MSVRTRFLPCAICLLLAGCATNPRQNTSGVADWQDIDLTSKPALAGAKWPSSDPAPSPPISNPPPVVKATPKQAPFETWVPIQRWSRSKGLASPSQLSRGPVVTYALKSPNGVLVLSAGTQFARWDGLDLRLGFAPQLIDGQIYVHGLDLIKTIEPLVRGEPRPALNPSPVLVIDPGHGGENAGTRSVLGGHYEKEFTLDWALRLQNVMQAKGWQVYLTRSNDTDLALSNRVAFAAAHKAALFVSLHFNSAGEDTSESGLETYCLTPAGMPSSLTRGFADEVTQSFPNNAFDTQNFLLALSVHRAVLQVNGHLDRGVRRARFPGVLRNQDRPAILVEGGYLSSPAEARLISEASYRQRLAEAVARGIDAYGVQFVSRSPQSTVSRPLATAHSGPSSNPAALPGPEHPPVESATGGPGEEGAQSE